MTESTQTAVQDWNITTLKVYLEQQIASVENETDLKFAARDVALQKQFDADQIHFKALNNEAARILKATEVTVSRDTWNAFLEAFHTWETGVNRLLQDAVTRHEFQVYKDTAEKEMNTKAGQAAAFNRVPIYIAAAASLALIANILWPLFRQKGLSP